MRSTFVIGVMVGLAVTVGCTPSVRGVSAAGTGPHPPAMPAGAAIPTWDHWCVNPQDQLAQVLAEAGPQGWELVGMTMTNTALFMCFKRPHVAAPPTTPAAAP